MTDPLMISMTRQPALDGKPVKVIELKNSIGMSVTFMDVGATWLSCCLPLADDELREVLLGVNTIEDFEMQQTYMGATVGRYANRIANGVFSINDTSYQLEANQAGNCLHGGKIGLNKVRWEVEEQSACHVLFSYYSADGDQGFPGNLSLKVEYRLTELGEVKAQYWASTDKTTPVNLTNHGYFNLDGAESHSDARYHQLKVDADYYLPVDAKGIPFGELSRVDGTSFDFRIPKALMADFLSDQQQQQAKGYDHSFFFDPQRDTSLPVAQLTSRDNKVTMTVVTDKPAMQLYSANWLAGTPSRTGEYSDYAGVALESQLLPDSPNHPEWPQPSCFLHPDEEYCYHTYYRFSF